MTSSIGESSDSFSSYEEVLDIESAEVVPELVRRTFERSYDEESMGSADSISSSRSSLDAVRDFFIPSSHPSKLKKYEHILNEYIKGLGGLEQAEIALKCLEDFDQRNPMVEHITNAYRALLGKGKWAGKNERERYRDVVKELRAAIETYQYKKLRKGPIRNPRAVVCVEIIQNLVKARWFQSEMYSHLKSATKLFTGSPEGSDSEFDLDDLSEEEFAETFREMNGRIKTASPEIRKRQMSLWKQQLQGATGLKDFSGTENIPFIRCRYEYQNEDGSVETIDYMRHSRPTVGGNFLEFVGGVISRVFCKVFRVQPEKAHDGEEIASDYEEAIRIAKDHGEAIFYVVHQRRTPGTVENEADSTKLIESLDRKHPNFHVLIQSVEGPLFQRGEGYDFLRTMDHLKTALVDSFRDSPTSPNRVPDAVNTDEYRAFLGNLFDDVRGIFFPDISDDHELTQEEWEKMILYFYVFQKDDLKFRLNDGDYKVKYYTTPCKDFLDRGGNMAMVEDFVHYHMAGRGPSSEDLQHTLYTTLGAPILVKKKQVIEHRVERGLEMVEDLSKLSPDQEKKLREYRFHGRALHAVSYPK